MTPIILINHNRLVSIEKLCDQLLVLGYTDIHIADMGSTYLELLSWYEHLRLFSSLGITVHNFENLGHKGIWNNGFIKSFDTEWVCVSDSDIELSVDTPKDFIEQMITVAKDYRVDKCGLAIKYKGLSNKYLANIVEPIEAQYWKQKLVHHKHSVYNAPVDTTMCVVRPKLPFQYEAVRLADWPIRHLDWYSDFSNLTEEEQFYMDTADEKISTTKQHYLKWLKEH